MERTFNAVCVSGSPQITVLTLPSLSLSLSLSLCILNKVFHDNIFQLWFEFMLKIKI